MQGVREGMTAFSWASLIVVRTIWPSNEAQIYSSIILLLAVNIFHKLNLISVIWYVNIDVVPINSLIIY